MNNKSILDFKIMLRKKNWNLLFNLGDTNDAYYTFRNEFSLLYDECFLLKEIKIRTK